MGPPVNGAVPVEFGCPTNFSKLLTAVEKKFINDYAATLLSMVAHVFKVRGHHWMKDKDDSFDTTYENLVRVCQLDEAMYNRLFTHCSLARYACHCVVPILKIKAYETFIDTGLLA